MVVALRLPADEPAWAAIWFPWNPTYASWDWNSGGRSITIESATDADFPAGVKTWDLAVCSANDPAKKVLVPLKNPLSLEGEGGHLELALWTPGRFPVGPLEALGEGTFLCAIVGDGQRYSNVSRVIISHSYQRTPQPGVQVFALPFPDHDIRKIAVRAVPAPGEELYMMDLAFPAISINGSWSRASSMAWKGQNPQLQSGTPYVRIVSLENYDPPIPPFKKADVQVKIVENFQKAFGAIQPLGAGENHATAAKTWIDSQPGPSSLVCTLTATETDAINFDQAFDLK
ncbi:MAG TPA: hypothetical protein VHY09_14895 [Candidatus Methylacidiphilales bacterium]|nr:hypothetical protein [Candidatus Methylacidiphilales bacterium]